MKFINNEQKICHFSDPVTPTDFILGINVQPNKAHTMTQVSMTLTEGQDQISLKMGKKLINWPYLGCYFTYRLHTWYQGITQ